MKWFRLSELLPIICLLFIISCENSKSESDAGFPMDQESAKLSGDISLINLSKDVKTHTLKFGDENALMKTEGAPVQAKQIHEKTFYVYPAAYNSRLILVGKIRVEVCRGKKDSINVESRSMCFRK